MVVAGVFFQPGQNMPACLPQLAVAYCWEVEKLYWLALLHTDSCRDLDIGAFLLRVYRGWHRVDGASLGSAKLQNLIKNMRDSSVGCGHVYKQPHLSLISKLHKEQRLEEALGITSGWKNRPASISNFRLHNTSNIPPDISPFSYL